MLTEIKNKNKKERRLENPGLPAACRRAGCSMERIRLAVGSDELSCVQDVQPA